MDESVPVELSVVVPSFNGAKRAPVFLLKLGVCLDEIPVASEIVFVDNGSTDGTADAAGAALPSAVIVRIDPNRGSSGGRNEGARQAQGRWLLLCDDDVALEPGSLRHLWESRDPAACVVPRLHDLRGELLNSISAEWNRGDLKFVEHPNPVEPLAYPVSACMLLERRLYWDVGGFDERYQPNVYEDVAFGFALHRSGVDTRMISDAVAVNNVHGDERTVTQHREEYRHRIYKNRWLFNLLELRGWRRWMVMALGVPRVSLESARTRSLGPAVGFVTACRVFVRLKDSGGLQQGQSG